ncbi:hypothetical protein BGZ83_010912 [Gryganskiella cystojenkinii]|nr:hypothetical protein BGZ83_010912 [Gryganskiella cystojenkinii]
MTSKPLHSPLEIPEILARVAYYTPCWVLERNPYRTENKYRPKTLHQCILVSKIWYQTFKPFLWELMNGLYFEKAPVELIHRHCHLFRIFKSFRSPPGPYTGCTNLSELYMTICEDYERGVRMEDQKQLVKQNRDLLKLYWHGPLQLTPLDQDSLIPLIPVSVDVGSGAGNGQEQRSSQRRGYTRISDLSLLKWEGSNGRLASVLHSVSGTLTRLALYSIYGISREELFVPADILEKIGSSSNGQDEHDSETLQQSSLDQGRCKREELLELPHVVRLAFRINHNESTGLEDLIRLCPNLRKLSVIPEKDYDMDRLTRNIQLYCPAIEALTMKYSTHEDDELGLILDSCKHSYNRISIVDAQETIQEKEINGPAEVQGRGLVRLRLNIHDISASLTCKILNHASHLEVLKLSAQGQARPLRTSELIRILMGCPRLRCFQLTGNLVSQGSRLERALIKNGSWGCSKTLERLSLQIELDEGQRRPGRLQSLQDRHFVFSDDDKEEEDVDAEQEQEAMTVEEDVDVGQEQEAMTVEEDENSEDDEMCCFYIDQPLEDEQETEEQQKGRARSELTALRMLLGSAKMSARCGSKSFEDLVQENFDETLAMAQISSVCPVWGGWTLAPPPPLSPSANRADIAMYADKLKPKHNVRFLRQLLQHTSTMTSMKTLDWNSIQFLKGRS